MTSWPVYHRFENNKHRSESDWFDDRSLEQNRLFIL